MISKDIILYKRLLSHVLPYWKRFLLSIVSMIVLAATDPAIPALMQPMLDGAFVEKDPDVIIGRDRIRRRKKEAAKEWEDFVRAAHLEAAVKKARHEASRFGKIHAAAQERQRKIWMRNRWSMGDVTSRQATPPPPDAPGGVPPDIPPDDIGGRTNLYQGKPLTLDIGDDIQADLLNEKDFRKVRATKLSLIPQGAMNSLNPTMKVYGQIKDLIQTHEGKKPKNEIKDRVNELLNKVGLPSRTADMFPHELSGGMKQRVCIAIGIALHPSLVIADESTSALDVIVQRVVAQTLSHVQKEMGVSMIMIGHDMGLMAQMVDRVAVMYLGHIVELAETDQLFVNALNLGKAKWAVANFCFS